MNRLILLFALACCSRTDTAKANSSAHEYMRDVPGATGAQCADTDSDGDGYVSCTIFRGSADPLPIQCGSEKWCVWNCASGCKYTPFLGGARRQ